MKDAFVGFGHDDRFTVITAFANGRVEFDLGEERHVQLFTERATAALAKDIVSLTTSADESAHVLDDTQDADVGLAREIGGSRGDALGRDRRRRHDS